VVEVFFFPTVVHPTNICTQSAAHIGGKARGLSNDKPLWHLAGSWLEVGLAYSFQGSIPGTNIFLNIAFLVLSNVTADSIHLFMC
jgi:hypothetical protein